MNQLEARYLKENNFRSYEKGKYTSDVKQGDTWCKDLENIKGFCDEKQLEFIKVQFGEKLLKRISSMQIVVRHINLSEYEVKLIWRITADKDDRESSISGEGIYERVSQAIVLADVDEF